MGRISPNLSRKVVVESFSIWTAVDGLRMLQNELGVVVEALRQICIFIELHRLVLPAFIRHDGAHLLLKVAHLAYFNQRIKRHSAGGGGPQLSQLSLYGFLLGPSVQLVEL